MRRTAAIVSTKFPFPNDDGKKTVLAGFLAYLIDRFGGDNVTYVVIGRRSGAAHAQAPCRTLWIDPPGWMSQAWNMARCIAGIDALSMQEAVTRSSRVRRRLDVMIESLRPELVILDTLRIGQYFSPPAAPGVRRILYMDDLFSVRFRRMTELSKGPGGLRFDPAGTFSSMLPGPARALIQLGAVQRLLYRSESARVERRERDCTAQFDRCLLINPNEARLLAQACPGAPVSAVKPLLFHEPCRVERRFDGTPSFLLFGSLRHPVYRASVIRFLEGGMEEILRLLPQARILIVGDGGGIEMARLCARFGSHVEIKGFVESLDEVFATSCALVVPLLAAGGLKLKILTALHYGLPIIANDASVDGIPLQAGVHFVRENAIERFPMHMARLCEVDLNRQISRNASALFRGHFSKDVVFREYDELLRQ
jgi:glycosyltransferase involved in cell wall biosynthesis